MVLLLRRRSCKAFEKAYIVIDLLQFTNIVFVFFIRGERFRIEPICFAGTAVETSICPTPANALPSNHKLHIEWWSRRPMEVSHFVTIG